MVKVFDHRTSWIAETFRLRLGAVAHVALDDTVGAIKVKSIDRFVLALLIFVVIVVGEPLFPDGIVVRQGQCAGPFKVRCDDVGRVDGSVPSIAADVSTIDRIGTKH